MSERDNLMSLLQIAVDNGWSLRDNSIYIDNSETIPYITNIDGNLYCTHINESGHLDTFSMDSVVCNHKNHEISFIQALCNANIEAVKDFRDFHNSAVENIVLLWNFTAYQGKQRLVYERLTWLFGIFKHLLQT